MPKENDAVLRSWAAIAQVFAERIGNIVKEWQYQLPAGLKLLQVNPPVTPMMSSSVS
jgi:hypothetical protein